MIKLNKYLAHTAVVERNAGSVDAAGNLLRASSSQWIPVGTPSLRKLPTELRDSQQAMEASTDRRVLAFLAYALPGSDILYGDRLLAITTKATGGTTSGGAVWGTPAAVLEPGPAYVRGLGKVNIRGTEFMVLRCEKIE